jgi:hypothetical protein
MFPPLLQSGGGGGFTKRVLIVDVLLLRLLSPSVATVAVFIEGFPAVAVGKTLIVMRGACCPVNNLEPV